MTNRTITIGKMQKRAHKPPTLAVPPSSVGGGVCGFGSGPIAEIKRNCIYLLTVALQSVPYNGYIIYRIL